MESINEKGSIMISVAMATYNGENYISEQIDSIINQTRKVDEIVIVDDHSTDQTVPILLHLQRIIRNGTSRSMSVQKMSDIKRILKTRSN